MPAVAICWLIRAISSSEGEAVPVGTIRTR
jgi:hypothetical protein